MAYLKRSILALALITASSAQANVDTINFTNDMTLGGTAYINEGHVQNGVVLTRHSTNQKGSAFTNLSYNNITNFTASFDMKLGGGRVDGSGLTFAWVTNPNARTDGAGGLGFTGMDGYAVEFDTFVSSNRTDRWDDGSDNHIAILKDTTQTALLQTEITDFTLSDNRYRNVDIEFNNGSISVDIDGRNYIDSYMIENYSAIDGYFGFTAATGGTSSDWHKVRNFELAVSPVPEPSTYALMLGGLGLVGFMAYRRRKTA